MGKEQHANIHKALLSGDQKTILSFLKTCSVKTVNTRDDKGQTPLHIACTNEALLPIVRRLIKKKALVDCSDILGWTPLHLAAKYNNYKICEELIQARANIYSVTQNQNSVLSFLVRGDSSAPFRFSLLQKILPQGLNTPNEQGETPFTQACMFGNDEIVELLLQHEPNVNARTKTNSTPLHYAVHANCPIIVKLLLDAKADLSLEDDKGKTALDEANRTDPMISSFLKSRAGLLAGNTPRSSPVPPPRQKRVKAVRKSRSSFRKSKSSLLRSRSLSPRTREEFRKSRANFAPLLHADDDYVSTKTPVPPKSQARDYSSKQTSRFNERAGSEATVYPTPHLLPSLLHLDVLNEFERILAVQKGKGSLDKSLPIPTKRKLEEKQKILQRRSRFARPLSIRIEEDLSREVVVPESITMDEPPADFDPVLVSAWRTFEEILFTENQYVRQLAIAITVCSKFSLHQKISLIKKTQEFQYPLERRYRIIPEEDILRIFFNLNDLYYLGMHIIALLQEEKSKQKFSARNVGQCFLQCIELFSAFKIYCMNQTLAAQTLEANIATNKRFRNFLLDAKTNGQSMEDLSGLLIKPFQRICRYVLLLKELARSMPEDWHTVETIYEAISTIDSIVVKANETKGFMDQEITLRRIRKMLDVELSLEQTSCLLHELDFDEFKKGKLTKRHLFLFNNMVLITKKKGGKGKHFTKYLIPLDCCLMWDQPDTKDKNSFILVRTDSPVKIQMVLMSEALKQTIMEKISCAIAEDVF